jgi:hypothetical protein
MGCALINGMVFRPASCRDNNGSFETFARRMLSYGRPPSLTVRFLPFREQTAG